MSSPILEPGMQVGPYQVVRPIGSGAMGGVWEVRDAQGQRFALKSPMSGVGRDATARFAREVNALRLLDHPNLVAAVDVFVESGFLLLVMEFVEGQTLSKRIAKGPLPPRQALVITRQILEGVGHAHAQGLVHRDLKPDNVMLVDMGGWESAKIVDFGLVKLVGDAAGAVGGANLTSKGIVFGTPLYMSPEQALGRPVDGRADLYAVGIILFEMLTGRPPFRHDDPMTVMKLQVKAPPPRLDQLSATAQWSTPQLVALVEGALAKEPAHRFPSAAAMIAALDDAFCSLDHLP